MIRRQFSRLIVCFLLLFPCSLAFSAEENFLLINGVTNATVIELGPHINERFSPCSTFKITLSLMGYDAGILQDQNNPTWDFKGGYDDWLSVWQSPQTPHSWMQYSCVWYSKVLSMQLGLERIQDYLTSMEYGNEDMSGGIAPPGATSVAWINSSLRISPKEQVDFIQKTILRTLPLSPIAIQMTKLLLFKEELPEGWKLYGKTGWSGSDIAREGETLEHGWFVGWIEKDHEFYPFAYLIRGPKLHLEQRIPRVKQLLADKIPMIL